MYCFANLILYHLQFYKRSACLPSKNLDLENACTNYVQIFLCVNYEKVVIKIAMVTTCLQIWENMEHDSKSDYGHFFNNYGR